VLANIGTVTKSGFFYERFALDWKIHFAHLSKISGFTNDYGILYNRASLLGSRLPDIFHFQGWIIFKQVFRHIPIGEHPDNQMNRDPCAFNAGLKVDLPVVQPVFRLARFGIDDSPEPDGIQVNGAKAGICSDDQSPACAKPKDPPVPALPSLGAAASQRSAVRWWGCAIWPFPARGRHEKKRQVYSSGLCNIVPTSYDYGEIHPYPSQNTLFHPFHLSHLF
jgi:hypothetical protein